MCPYDGYRVYTLVSVSSAKVGHQHVCGHAGLGGMEPDGQTSVITKEGHPCIIWHPMLHKMRLVGGVVQENSGEMVLAVGGESPQKAECKGQLGLQPP